MNNLDKENAKECLGALVKQAKQISFYKKWCSYYFIKNNNLYFKTIFIFMNFLINVSLTLLARPFK